MDFQTPSEPLSTETRISIPPKNKHSIIEKILLFFLALIVVYLFIISPFLLSPFQISGKSMEPNYFDREFILVDKFSYFKVGGFELGSPIRGDAVIIKPHAANGKEYYIKRVIGLPGEIISFRYGKVYIQTSPSSPEIELHEGYLQDSDKDRTFPPLDVSESSFQIPEGQYFLIGDNRSNSVDSRHCFLSCSMPNTSHFLKRENIVGKVFFSFGYVPLFEDENVIEPQKRIPGRGTNTLRKWNYPEIEKNMLQKSQ